MHRRYLLLLGLAVAPALAVVGALYGAEIARWAAAALSGWLAWKLLLGRAGFRSGGTVKRVWRLVETAWVAWVTVNVGRARRARISAEECRPIASLQTDEIPF